MRTGLSIVVEAGPTLWWPYAEVRQTQGFYAGEQVRLERGPGPEVVLIDDAAFLTAMHAAGGETARRFHDPARRRARVQLTLLAAGAVVAIGAAIYLWVIPAVAGVVAARVPVAWEERLGDAVVAELAPPSRRCAGAPGTAAIAAITHTLVATVPDAPYTFRVLVVDGRPVNAFAAPGGYVVVFRELLQRTRRPEELAGVLAHEFQHVLHRHVTRAIVHDASSGLLLTALTGDMTGLLAYSLEAARTLGRLRYSRGAEEEADTEGMRMLLRASIDPTGMIGFFELLRKETPELTGQLAYLSTHPATDHRLAQLRALAAAAGGTPRPLLPDVDWDAVKQICDGGAARS
jgi:predicted Zn-dependent protease